MFRHLALHDFFHACRIEELATSTSAFTAAARPTRVALTIASSVSGTMVFQFARSGRSIGMATTFL
jgi:hypothetical protein